MQDDALLTGPRLHSVEWLEDEWILNLTWCEREVIWGAVTPLAWIESESSLNCLSEQSVYSLMFEPWIARNWSKCTRHSTATFGVLNVGYPLVRVKVSYFTTGGLPPISPSWRQAPWDSRPVFFFQLNNCGYSPIVPSSLTKVWVCCLQLLLALASAVILRSVYRGTHDYIFLSQIRDSPNLEGQVPVFISPKNRVAQLYPQQLGSLFVAS
jgi:hypothetical protein